MDPELAALRAAEAVALYLQMSPQDLQRLRVAFEADLRDATRPETIAFCRNRLALIEAVLCGHGNG